jgi:hypothetical protein
MGLSVYLTAYLCKKYSIPVSKVLDHSELCDIGLASNHSDITHWLKLYGVTMKDYREAVSAAIQEGVQVTYVEGDKVWTDGDAEEEKPAVPDLDTKKALLDLQQKLHDALVIVD